MNNENVLKFPNCKIETPEEVLNTCINFDRLTDVLILGLGKEDNLVVRSSKMSRADALFILEKAKQWVLFQ